MGAKIIKYFKQLSITRKVILILIIAYIFCLPRQLFHVPYSTVVTDRNGELLGARIASDGQWRFPPRTTTPEKVKQCLITFEDRHFYHHWGVNPVSTGRAAYQNLKNKRIVSGGSTLTMQTIRLARNESRTFGEKFIEMILATRLEFRASKENSEKSPRIAGEGSRYVYSDEMLALMAKVGEMHLDGSEPNYTVLFDNDSCALKIYEDWIDEYLECDLPGEIKEKQPDLLPLLDKIREEVKNIRDRLRPIYGKLPKSLFHSEEQRNNQLLSEDGHLIGLCDFNDGGLDTCIAHFLHVAMITDEELPEDYVWLEANDPDVRQKRLDSLIHSFRVIGKEYNFSEDELAALPLVYKIMLFGGVYYYGTVFRLMDNHDQLKELLEYILNQLFTDQIDFGKILAKTNK